MRTPMDEPPQSRPVGIWVRVSTDDQARGESPEHHEKRAQAYAEAKGWQVVEVYHLEGVSGKSVMQHPEAKRMLADLKSGRIHALIFSKLARLARNTKELLEFADIFREYGADLVSLGESIDTSTPAGRLFYTMIAAMAAWEREEIASRVAVSIPIRAKLGKPLGGKAPFGYRWENRKIVIDPVEGPVRRLVYELFAEHKRKRVVARILNDAGHRTRGKVKFTHLFIKRIISDPISKGARRTNYTSHKNGKIVLKPHRDWMTLQVPAVVSEELWDRCNAILADQRAARRPVAKRVVQIFAGLAFCVCGSKMYVRSNSPKYVCDKCRNKIPIVDLEEVFREQLAHYSISPTELAAYMRQADEHASEKRKSLGALMEERRHVTEAMDGLFDLYTKRMIGADVFSTRYRPLEDRTRQLDEQIPGLQAELDFLAVGTHSQEELIQSAKSLYDRWPTLTREEKRQIVESVTERITIGKGEVTINLCYLPSREDMTKGGQIPSLSILWSTARQARTCWWT